MTEERDATRRKAMDDPVVDLDPGEPDVAVDKDLLRGGSGEDGKPRHPATDEDLLRGGTGWSESPREG